MRTQDLWLCAVLLTATSPLAGAEPPTPAAKSEPTARGLAEDKAVAAFYHPDEVQSVHLSVAADDLKRMLEALPELIDVPATFRWRDVTVENVRAEHMIAVLEAMRAMGIHVDLTSSYTCRIRAPRRIRPVDITTLPFPGFPTDLQSQFMAMLTLADGMSIVTEKIYPDRFMHVPELARMGAQIRKQESAAIIAGVRKLSGAPVMASDLRASASLVLAGLVARGQTDVQRVYHLDRGYERLEQKLQAIGADIERLNDG